MSGFAHWVVGIDEENRNGKTAINRSSADSDLRDKPTVSFAHWVTGEGARAESAKVESTPASRTTRTFASTIGETSILSPKAYAAMQSWNTKREKRSSADVMREIEELSPRVEHFYDYALKDTENLSDAYYAHLAETKKALSGRLEGLRKEYAYRNQNEKALALARKQAEWKKNRRGTDVISLNLDTVTGNIKDLEREEGRLAGVLNDLESGRDLPEFDAANYEAVKRQHDETARRLVELEPVQKELSEELDYSKKLDWEELRNNPDFAEKSRHASTGATLFKSAGGELDAIYGAVNRESAAWAQYAASRLPGELLKGQAPSGGIELSQITESERETFNYLYATDKEKAREYFDELRPKLTARQRRGMEDYLHDWTQKSGWNAALGSGATVLTSPLKAASYAGQTADYLTTGKVDQNALYNAPSYWNNAVRGAVTENWDKLGTAAYQTAMSMGDFLWNAFITGGLSAGGAVAENLSLAIMGAEAAADTVIAQKDRGMDDTRAFILGTAAGLAEVVTEKVSLEALLNPELSRGTFRYIIKNMLAEGSEEVASDLLNYWADGLYDVISGQSESEWKKAVQRYRDMGYTEAEAFGKAVGDKASEMGMDFLGGAVSGGLMAGGSAAINAYQNGKKNPASMWKRGSGHLKLNNVDNTENAGYNYLQDGGAENARSEAGLGADGDGSFGGAGNGVGGLQGSLGDVDQRRIEAYGSASSPLVVRISPELNDAYKSRGIVNYELHDSFADGAAFSFALNEARNADGVNGWAVTPKTAEELAENSVRTFVTEEGDAGFGVAQDGDIEAVFKNLSGGKKRILDTLIPMALENGGTKLDCYGEKLANVYAKFGFIPVARVEFNEAYANPGWTPEKGTPYIYFMMHSGESAADVISKKGTYKVWSKAELEALPLFDKESYDAAYAYRDSLMKGEGNIARSGASGGGKENVKLDKRINPENIEKEFLSDSVTPKPGTAAAKNVNFAEREYGIKAYAVKQDVWNKYSFPGEIASRSGAIYMSDAITETDVIEHEATHIMRQDGFKPYLDFLEKTPEMLNMYSPKVRNLLQDIFAHIRIKDKADISELADNDRLRLHFYDELNATLYGHIANGKTSGYDASGNYLALDEILIDLADYSSRMRALHEEYKRWKRSVKGGVETFAADGYNGEKEARRNGHGGEWEKKTSDVRGSDKSNARGERKSRESTAKGTGGIYPGTGIHSEVLLAGRKARTSSVAAPIAGKEKSGRARSIAGYRRELEEARRRRRVGRLRLYYYRAKRVKELEDEYAKAIAAEK